MKILAAILLLCTLTNIILSANGNKRNNIIGSFKKDGGESTIEVKYKNRFFQGYIVENNKKPESVGTHLFRDIKYDANKMLWVGKLYVKKRDKLYDFDIVQESDKKFVMTIKLGILSKDIVWIKQ